MSVNCHCLHSAPGNRSVVTFWFLVLVIYFTRHEKELNPTCLLLRWFVSFSLSCKCETVCKIRKCVPSSSRVTPSLWTQAVLCTCSWGRCRITSFQTWSDVTLCEHTLFRTAAADAARSWYANSWLQAHLKPPLTPCESGNVSQPMRFIESVVWTSFYSRDSFINEV